MFHGSSSSSRNGLSIMDIPADSKEQPLLNIVTQIVNDITSRKSIFKRVICAIFADLAVQRSHEVYLQYPNADVFQRAPCAHGDNRRLHHFREAWHHANSP